MLVYKKVGEMKFFTERRMGVIGLIWTHNGCITQIISTCGYYYINSSELLCMYGLLCVHELQRVRIPVQNGREHCIGLYPKLGKTLATEPFTKARLTCNV